MHRTKKSDLTTIILLLAACASALIGQSQIVISSPGEFGRVLVWWIVGALFFGLLVIYHEQRTRLLRGFDDSPMRFRRVLLFALAALCAIRVLTLIVHKETEGIDHYGDTFLFWIGALLLILAAVIQRPQISVRNYMKAHREDLIALAVLTFVAGLLRFVALGVRPAVVGGDEGLFGMIGLATLEGGFSSPFSTVFGAGTLFVHEITGWMRLFGENAFGLRAASAFGGMLAVPVVYLLGRELYNRRVGWIAAAVMAVSHFHVHFSRMVAVTYIQGTFYSTLTLYLLITGLRRHSYIRMALAGIVMAIYLMIYLDSRVIAVVLVLILVAFALLHRAWMLRNVRPLFLFAITFLIIASPMLMWALRHPDEFNARFSAAGTFQTSLLEVRAEETGKGALQLIGESYLSNVMTLVTIHVYDFYFNDYAILPTVLSGALFLLGLIYTLMHVRRIESLLLNIWLWAGIMALSLATLNLFAGGYRLLLVFPVVCILVGVGLDRLVHYLDLSPRMAVATTALVTLCIAVINFNIYFVTYLPSCRFGGDVATRLNSVLGEYLGDLDRDTHAYLFTDTSVEAGTHPSLDFLSGRKQVINLYDALNAETVETLDINPPVAFIAVSKRVRDISTVATAHPGGRLQQVFDCGKQVFTTYYLDRPESAQR